MLSEQVRRVLSWVTVFVIAVVVISGMIKILTFITRSPQAGSAMNVVPAEITLCQREQSLFTVQPDQPDLEWAATGGGEISSDGLYTAGDVPGDYEIQVAGTGRQRGRAVVHIVSCTPTPTPAPTPTSEPTPTPTPQPTPISDADPQGDTVIYSTGAPAGAPFAGLDIRNASVAADGRVVLGSSEGLPTEVAQWVQPGEMALWFAFYEPIADPPLEYTEWLFVLDLDGNTGTGRPSGSRPMNPGLGDEVAIAVFYDPATASYGSYLLVWSAAQQDWTTGPEVVRYQLDSARTLLAVALPLDVLQTQVAQVTGVTVVPEAVRGRAATLAYSGSGPNTWVADFYP